MSATQPVKSGRRVAPLLLLLLHVLVAGLMPIADASVERTARDGTLHVESDDRPSCPAPHDHLKCQLCRHMTSSLLGTADVARVPEQTAFRPCDFFAHDVILACADAGLPVGSRAPPLV